MLELENLESKFARIYKPIFAAISITLLLVFYCLFVLFLWHSLFLVVGYYHAHFQSIVLDAVLLAFNLWTAGNVFFNYLMAASTDPGTSYLNESPELQQVVRICRRCHCKKPSRAHHCSVCQRCIFQFDHHCPWIYNCVGHHNRRYFLLMLTWITVHMNVLLLLNHFLPQDDGDDFNFIMQILTASLAAVLNLFGLWHWYIAVKGVTTVEWMDGTPSFSKSKIQNLQLVFGTRNIFRMLLPSFRELKNDGIAWPLLDMRSEQIDQVDQD